MDDYVNLLARAAQCRRLASNLLDTATLETLLALAGEFEDRAAIAATAHLHVPGMTLDARYTISRANGGWMVSRGGDRIVVRPTLQGARDEAQRLAAFDSAAE
jgi:hypothetical protein